MFKLGDLILLFSLLITVNGESETTKGPLRDMEFPILEGRPVVSPLHIYQFVPSNPSSTDFRLSGEVNGIFEIASDGWLKLVGTLDREKKALYRLQISAINGRGDTMEGPYSINIIVEDINDNVPVFNQSEYFGSVRQNYFPGKPFLYVYATDLDDPSTPNAKLSYSILQQIPDPYKKLLFSINNKTGAISINHDGFQNLDPTKMDTYELLVTVKDLEGMSENAFSNNARVYITVKDNIWQSPQPQNVYENSTQPHPINITKVTWNEPGAKYELQEIEKNIWRWPFSIDQDGNIYVTRPLDREEKDQYVFLAVVKDTFGKMLSYPIKIEVNVLDINDNPPVCEKAVTIFEVQENEGMGSNIGTLLASDMDQEDTRNSLLIFRILDQNPKIPQNDLFRVDLFSGVFQLNSTGLQKKDADQYNLTVEVADEGFPTALRTICDVQIHVIDINNEIPIFEKSDYGNLTLAEDTPVGTVILEIQATDGDEPSTGSSAINYKVHQGDQKGHFEITTNPQTNKGYMKINQPLDFETFPVYDLVIQATNPEPLVKGVDYTEDSFTRVKIFVSDVNEVPVFNQSIYQAQFDEDIPVGTKLKSITAYDPEGDEISFEISNDKLNWLNIDKRTGDIFSAAPLDREKQSTYEVTVRAFQKNAEYLSSSVLFQLHLNDVNDNPPRLAKDYSDTFFCHPIAKRGSVLIEATDDDYSRFGHNLKFELGENQNIKQDWELHSINGTHANLSMKHTNFEIQQYPVHINIKERRPSPLETNVTILVYICACTDTQTCYYEVPGLEQYKVVLAVGILLGTLAFIGLIVAVVFIRLNQKKKDEKKVDATYAKTPAETSQLNI
ncbi:cadherin-17 [Microcaecilia unicolor]|uniref:Cadherin-17 n=1 Tax=Microcaecilia unicolor TaxID=1415580 RepID=A0A6P7Z521_9AMPH|nr:cadherin-17 [Microcaecilia unicolor]